MCSAITEIAENHHELQTDTGKVVKNFQEVFTLFGKCHRGYNSSTYKTDEEIDKIGKGHVSNVSD